MVKENMGNAFNTMTSFFIEHDYLLYLQYLNGFRVAEILRQTLLSSYEKEKEAS